MNVLIVGSEGSMGWRYQTILKSLGEVPIRYDHTIQGDDPGALEELVDYSDRIIIATPTETHFDLVTELSKTRKPILCEKPLSKNLKELFFIKQLVTDEKINLTMTMQYRMLDQRKSSGVTEYNYFRHGNDGLYWDCIQPIGLARGKIVLGEDSPIWTCRLNGEKLNLSDMDKAYVDFVRRWLKKPGDDISEIIDMHIKVMELKNEKAN